MQLNRGVIVFEEDKFLVNKKFIDQMDYYALLAGGSPPDEFDLESKMISEMLHHDHSAQEIANIIASVFNKQFGEHDDASVFLSVAERSKSEQMIWCTFRFSYLYLRTVILLFSK